MIFTQELWRNWYKRYQSGHRESVAYIKLVEGPNITTQISKVIPRDDVIETVKTLISPTTEAQSYPLIVGEHGTGKTSLLRLAVEKMKDRRGSGRGIVYADVPDVKKSPAQLAQAIEEALGLKPNLGESYPYKRK